MPVTVQVPVETIEKVLELLSEREWTSEYNPRSNYCQECGANVKGSGIPEHHSDCMWVRSVDQLEESLKSHD